MANDYKYTTRRLNELLATTHNKTYFVGFVTVGFIIIMTLVGILPSYSAFTFQSEENARRATLVEKLTKKLEISKNLSNELNQKGNLIKFFDYAFPSQPNQDDIIDILDSLAVNNNVKLSRITFSDKPSQNFLTQNYEDSIKSQQVGIALKGSKTSLLNIIKDIESNRRIINILSLSLDKNIDIESVEASLEFTLNLQLEYYYYFNTLQTL